MKLSPKYLSQAAVVALGSVLPAATFAQTVTGGRLGNPFDRSSDNLRNTQAGAEVTASADLPTIIGRVINVLLGFLGIVLLFYVLLAGFKWMTAGGNEKATTEAKEMIKNAVIGMVIIVAGFAISNFVITQLTTLAQ